MSNYKEQYEKLHITPAPKSSNYDPNTFGKELMKNVPKPKNISYSNVTKQLDSNTNILITYQIG